MCPALACTIESENNNTERSDGCEQRFSVLATRKSCGVALPVRRRATWKAQKLHVIRIGLREGPPGRSESVGLRVGFFFLGAQ